ncbi:hypothetical protein Esti_002629 [Eimeria stiedai]
MKVVEFRLVLPLTPEEYRRCQIFLVALAALETAEAQKATGGPPKTPMIEVLASEDYQEDGEQGQFTHKRIDLAERLPAWILRFVDHRSCCFEEKSVRGLDLSFALAWLQSAKFLKAKVSITSNHISGVCTDDNALKLPPDKLKQRQVDLIDIVNDRGPQGSGASDDLRNWRSQKAGFGPLKSDWFKNVPLVPRRPPRPPSRSRQREGASARGKQEGPLSGEGGPNNAAEQGSSQGLPSSPPTTGAPPHQPLEEPSGGAPSLAAGVASGKQGPSRDGSEGPPVSTGGPLGEVVPPSEGPPPPLEPAYPLMTCYKCFEVHFPYFGLFAGRIEAWVVSSMREQLMQYHRKAIACIDRWYDMSLEEVRKFEDDVRQQLAVLAALSRDAAGGGPPSQRASQRDTAGASSREGGSRRASLTAEGQASSDSEEDVEGPHVEGPPQQLLEALEDRRIYAGTRLLPLRLSPHSVSLLQRLRKRILSSPQPDRAQPSPPSQQQQQQKQQQQVQGGPPLRSSGSFRVSGDLQEGGPIRKEGPTRHGFLDKLADGYWGTGWNARYFLLRGPRLQYFDDPRDVKAKQSFTLTGATADWLEDMKERPYTFYVETPGRKRLILSGGTEEESLAWLSAIQSAALIGTPAAASSSSNSSSSSKEYGRSEQQEEFPRGSLSFAELPGVGGPLGPPAPLTETPLDLIASFPLNPAGPGEPPEGPEQSGAPRTLGQVPGGAPRVTPVVEGSQEASQGNKALQGTPASADKDSQAHDEALQQQMNLLKEPLKDVIVAVTRRCPRGRSFRREGLGSPHAVFLEEPERGTAEGLQRGALHRGPSARRLRDRNLWEVVEETEEKRDEPAVTEEAAALGSLTFGVLLLLLSAAAACCCCCSVLSFLCLATAALLRLVLAVSGLSRLLYGASFLLGEGGFSGSTGASGSLLEALRSVAAAAAAALLLRLALWVLASVACRGSRRGKGEEPSRGPPLLKVACLAEGAPASLLLPALPPDATPAAAGGPPDPSILAAGGPFLMEVSETVYPLELLLSDLGAACCLCWGALRRCLPRFFAAPLAFFPETDGPEQQRQQVSPGLRSSNGSSNGKLAAAKQLLLTLLRLLHMIASRGALALGGALGALLAALSGAPLGPLQLRRILWCVSLEGGGYLLLSLLSSVPVGPSQASEASFSGAPKGGYLWDLLARGAVGAMRLTASSLLRVNPTWGSSGKPKDSFMGVEGLLITPVPLESEEAQHVGPQCLQQLQQQQRWSLVSLQFEGAPVASAEGPVSRASQTPGSTAARGPCYSVSERGKALAATTLKSGAPEELLERPPILPAQGAVSEELCLLNWVGGPFQWGGPRGAPRWVEALLTLRRGETALASLLSQVGAQRTLHEVGPYHLDESRASAAGAPLKRVSLEPSLMLRSSCEKEEGQQGSLGELEGPLTEFYKTVGALEAPIARRLAKRRAQQRWQMEREPYPLSGWQRGPQGALQQKSSLLLFRQRALLLRLLQRQRANLPTGAPLPTSLLLPIGMLRPASMLVLLPECCAQGPPLLESAVAGGPLDRFKATVAFAVSILHRGCWQVPPFAACLGETFQGHFQRPPGHLASPHGGWLVYAEQTAVGPPSTLFCISHPGAPTRVFGHLAFHTAYQQNKCWVFVNGRISVSFHDGEVISFSLPQLHIEGLLWGPRLFSWRGPLVLEGPVMRCTLTVGGDSHPGSCVPLDEIFGHVERIGGSPQRDQKEGDTLQETPPTDGLLTGAYTDRLFWNDEV